jgi:chromosome segregation ATPase
VIDKGLIIAGLELKIKDLSITLNENLDKYLELDQNISEECLNVAVLRGEKDIQVAVNMTLNMFLTARKEKYVLIEKIESLEEELLIMQTQEKKTEIQIEELIMNKAELEDQMNKNEGRFYELKGKIEILHCELATKLTQEKIDKAQFEELTMSKAALECQINEEKTLLTESVVENNRLLIECNQLEYHQNQYKTQEKLSTAQFEELTMSKAELQCQMHDSKTRLNVSKAQIEILNTEISTMQMQEKTTKIQFEELTLNRAELECQMNEKNFVLSNVIRIERYKYMYIYICVHMCVYILYIYM